MRLGKLSRVVGVLVVVTCGIAVPAAVAQTVQLDSMYVSIVGGHNGTPSCPPGETLCGHGTDPTFGPFTYRAVWTDVDTATLSFASGNLVLIEQFGPVNFPGNSLLHQPSQAYGHPLNGTVNWDVDPFASTGSFLGATGSGTDTFGDAGIQIHGLDRGPITLP